VTELFRIDADAGLLHASEHAHQREVDGFVKLGQTHADLRTQLLIQRENRVGLTSGIGIEMLF